MAVWQQLRPYLSSFVRFLRISYIEAKAEHGSTRLGILWVPFTSLMFSAALALIFRPSHTVPVADFFLYVLAGYGLWSFISDTISDSATTIQRRFDFAIHNNLSLVGLFAKLLLDRMVIYGLNVIVLLLMLAVLSPFRLGLNLLLFAPFLALLALTALAVAYLINLLTIFFPDLRSPIKLITRFMFFASPVFWTVAERATGARGVLVKYNPVAYYLSVVRQVFGIEPFDLQTWLVVAVISIVLGLAGLVAFKGSEKFVRNLK